MRGNNLPGLKRPVARFGTDGIDTRAPKSADTRTRFRPTELVAWVPQSNEITHAIRPRSQRTETMIGYGADVNERTEFERRGGQ